MADTMRYHHEDKEKTRERILSVAARRYRAEGLNSVGIANLMADLGLTHGGFYAHFRDKEALVAAVCEASFSAQHKHWDTLVRQHPEQAPLEAILGDYLSRHHRDHPDTGCLAAALAGEMARRDTRSRAAFTKGIRGLLERLDQASDCAGSAEAILAQMLGAVILARAVSDPELSERFLLCARQALLDPDEPPR